MNLSIKTALVAGAVAVAGIAAYVLCSSGGATPPAKQTVAEQKPTAKAARAAGRDAPKAVSQGKPVAQAAEAEGKKVAPSLSSRREAIEAARREREAFMKMSPEEQKRFREQKREEMRARRRAAHGKGRRARLWHDPKESATAGAPGETAEEKAREKRAEEEELRSAALKARTEYEESMGEKRRARYKRRSVGYWMAREKERREREAARQKERELHERGGGQPSENQQQKQPKKENQ